MAGDSVIGGTLHLYASYSPASSQAFDRWTGDTQYLDDPLSSHAVLVRPSGVINLSATFKPIIAPQPTIATVGRSDLQYTIPSNPKGLIFVFHGAGQDASAWFTRPEQYQFVHAALGAGYGVAAVSSDTAGHWALAPISMGNIDVQHVQAAIQLLRTRGAITSTTRIFGVGTSQGGRMTVRAAPLLGFTAIANYVSQGDVDSLMLNFTVPARFNMRLNDKDPIVSNADAARYVAALQAKGIPAEYQVFGAAPIYPEIFTRIPGIDLASSNAIFAAFTNGGIVDAFGYLTIDPSKQKPIWRALVPAPFSTQAMLSLIQDCLEASYASHGFFAWADHVTLAFFDRIP